MATVETLDTKLKTFETQLKGFAEKLAKLEADMTSKSNTADLNRLESVLRGLITDNATLISANEQKLAKVILPEETRYYLTEGEVATFQSNFNQLKAMMTAFEKLYKNLVSYSTKLRAQ